jgi:hypothetical protein
MAAMYAKYKALERLLRHRAALLGSRGQGFATITKEQLFASVYTKQDKSLATREDCALE